MLLAGSVTLPDGRPARWQEARELPDLLVVEVDEVADILGALGNPVRLRLLLRILDEPQTVQELTGVEGVGTVRAGVPPPPPAHRHRVGTVTGRRPLRGSGRSGGPLLGALLSAGR